MEGDVPIIRHRITAEVSAAIYGKSAYSGYLLRTPNVPGVTAQARRPLAQCRPQPLTFQQLLRSQKYMSAEEFHELHEHAEHAAHDRSMAPVSLTMAILAVLV